MGGELTRIALGNYPKIPLSANPICKPAVHFDNICESISIKIQSSIGDLALAKCFNLGIDGSQNTKIYFGFRNLQAKNISYTWIRREANFYGWEE